MFTCRRSQRIRSDVVTAFLTTFVASNLPPVPLDQVEGPGKVSPSCWLLRVLIGARSKADQHPKSCLEYFHMMIGCLHNISKPEEVRQLGSSAGFFSPLLSSISCACIRLA